jgi:CRISPR-associated protein Csm1
VALTRSAAVTGRFGELAASGALRRCWDFSLPKDDDATGRRALWNGYARRYISAYIPRIRQEGRDLRDSGKYPGVAPEDFDGAIKTFDMIACEDRTLDGQDGVWRGVCALSVLKGDIDDLGALFRDGLGQPSFAKWASLSRQINSYFSIYLPWLMAREFQNVYTVFAGGDDFLLIGPWRTVQQLAARMQTEFTRYVAQNPKIHFSAGIVTQKAGAPIHALAELSDDALKDAKKFRGGIAGEKNAVKVFGAVVAWENWPELEQRLHRLDELRTRYGLTAGFVYGLLQFVEARSQEAAGRAEAAMWRSRLAYRTRRFIVDKLRERDEAARHRILQEILGEVGSSGIESLGALYRIVLFNHLYQFRDR